MNTMPSIVIDAGEELGQNASLMRVQCRLFSWTRSISYISAHLRLSSVINFLTSLRVSSLQSIWYSQVGNNKRTPRQKHTTQLTIWPRSWACFLLCCCLRSQQILFLPLWRSAFFQGRRTIALIKASHKCRRIYPQPSPFCKCHTEKPRNAGKTDFRSFVFVCFTLFFSFLVSACRYPSAHLPRSRLKSLF